MDDVDITHEELMRGSLAGGRRAAGTGTILDAVKGLRPTLLASTASCPAIPESLSDRYDEIQQRRKKPKGR